MEDVVCCRRHRHTPCPCSHLYAINFRRGLQHVRDVNPCDTTVEGRLGVNSAELDQLDSTALGLEKPVSKCSMFGREGDSSISSPRCHQSSPYRGQDYMIPYMVGKLSPNRTPFTIYIYIYIGSWSNMSSVWGTLVASPQKPGKIPTSPPRLHSINDYFVFNMILGTCGLSAGSKFPPVFVLPKGLLASNSVAPKGSRRFLKMTDICAGEPPLCPTGSSLGRMPLTRPTPLRLPKWMWSVTGTLCPLHAPIGARVWTTASFAYQYIMRDFAAWLDGSIKELVSQ